MISDNQRNELFYLTLSHLYRREDIINLYLMMHRHCIDNNIEISYGQFESIINDALVFYNKDISDFKKEQKDNSEIKVIV